MYFLQKHINAANIRDGGSKSLLGAIFEKAANSWIDHILRHNSLLKKVIEGRLRGKVFKNSFSVNVRSSKASSSLQMTTLM